MEKFVTIDKFFQRKRSNQLDLPVSTAPSIPSDDNLPPEVHSQKLRKVESAGVDLNFLERDPGLRRQIWEYSPNEQEEICFNHPDMSFFLGWSIPQQKIKLSVFLVLSLTSHRDVLSKLHLLLLDLIIGRRLEVEKLVLSNVTLGKMMYLHPIVWLKRHGVHFRGHDESSNSSNRGNFLEFLDVAALYNDELSDAIQKAPKNAKYTCHDIQKQILLMFSMRVKNVILEEIEASKYCITIDEARDESKREQMSIVLRSQGYNGARNMRDEFNGLQALILKDCKSAYYVHCFAHRLQ
ncbi:uncharacterized protein LOC142550005 [Primulina tabacum]|uniref:uncharacterized protein LOC142550005 n=1 Tax=Primulina tabacum TaxID=48773 RepID=UPI003F59EC97